MPPLPLSLRRHLTALNVRSGRIFALCLTPFLIALTAWETFLGTRADGYAFIERNAGLLCLRLAAIAFSVSFLLELHRLSRTHPDSFDTREHERATLWHASLIPLLCACIAAQQYSSIGDVTVYFLGLIFVTSVYVLPPRWFVPIVIVPALVLMAGILWTGRYSPQSPHNNALAATLGAAAIGIIRFRLHCRQFIQDRRLEDQRSSLAALNQALDHERGRLHDLLERQNEVVGVLAHDLKNPLSAAVGVADWMTDLTNRDDLPPDHFRNEVREAAADLRHVAASSLHLVERLLDSQRISAGDVSLDITLVDLAEVVGEGVTLHAGTARRKRIDLVLDMDPGLAGAPVRGDAEKLGVVVDNLIGNAIKYTQPLGKVTVRLSATDEGILLEVSDTGLGLLPEDLPRLFQRFQRLSARPTGGESSTGLGLAIVKRIVDLHGGRIQARSAGRDAGTTFSVLLPSVDPDLSDFPDLSPAL